MGRLTLAVWSVRHFIWVAHFPTCIQAHALDRSDRTYRINISVKEEFIWCLCVYDAADMVKVTNSSIAELSTNVLFKQVRDPLASNSLPFIATPKLRLKTSFR